MAYLRISDDLPDHPKISRISDGTFRLYINANCWCQKHLTDGKIPAASLQDIPRYRANRVAELLEAGLWHREGDGYRVHDFLEHNDSKDVIKARQKRTAERVASWRERHHTPTPVEMKSNGVSNALLTADVTPLVTPPLSSPLRTRSKDLVETPPPADWYSHCPHRPKCRSGFLCAERSKLDHARRMAAN